MKHPRPRKCLCCGALFRADPRSLRHQKYCSKAACRKASKAASERRWLTQPENRDYFRGPEHGARVQTWRQAPPRYRHRAARKAPALQEELVAQPAVLMGLIAPITDSAWPEDIARSTHRRVRLGQDILSGRAKQGDRVSDLRRSGAPGACPV